MIKLDAQIIKPCKAFLSPVIFITCKVNPLIVDETVEKYLLGILK